MVSNVALVPVIPPQLMPHTREMLENDTQKKENYTFKEKFASIHIRMCADMKRIIYRVGLLAPIFD